MNKQGGAQYILKGIDANFWKKVEKDSEELYVRMIEYNTKLWEERYPITKEYRSEKRGIQAWCADMWAVLWNLWLNNKQVKIHSELEFSWPYNPIEDWKKLAILHYSGGIGDNTKHFNKTEYVHFLPWYDAKLDVIPNESCSYEVVRQIKIRKSEIDLTRIKFDSVHIYLYSSNEGYQINFFFEIYKKYIQKYFNVRVELSTNVSLTSFVIFP